MRFPLSTWGRVVQAPPTEAHIQAVKVESAGGGAFLLLTREAGHEFDTWVESGADVEAYLARFVIEWPDQ